MTNLQPIALVLAITLLSLSATASKAEDYLTKINANYASLDAFQLSLNYKLYRGLNGATAEEDYTSTVYYKGNLSYRRLHQEETVTTAQNTIVLNHDLRTIQIMPAMEQNVFDIDIEKCIRQCRDIELKEVGDERVIRMIFKEVSTVPFAAIEIKIDKNYWVTKMTYFYAEQLNFSQDYFHPDFDFPRLEVTFSELTKSWPKVKDVTNPSKYITQEADGYKPSALYKNYEIIQH